MPRINTSGVTDAREPDYFEDHADSEETPECPGNNSSPSIDSKRIDTEKSETRDPSPVRTTEHPSKAAKAGNSTARSAGGSSPSK